MAVSLLLVCLSLVALMLRFYSWRLINGGHICQSRSFGTHAVAPSCRWLSRLTAAGLFLQSRKNVFTRVRMERISGDPGARSSYTGDRSSLPFCTWLSTLALLQNGQEIVVLSKAGGILHWKANVVQHIGRQTPYRSVAFSPDGRWIASGLNNGRVDVWEVDSQGIFHMVQQLNTIRIAVFPPGTELQSVQFSSDGRQIACGYVKGSISIWEFDPKGKLSPTQKIIYSPPLRPRHVPLGMQGFFSWDRQLVGSYDLSTVHISFASDQGKFGNFTKFPVDGHVLAVTVLPNGVRCISRPSQNSQRLHIWALNFATM